MTSYRAALGLVTRRAKRLWQFANAAVFAAVAVWWVGMREPPPRRHERELVAAMGAGDGHDRVIHLASNPDIAKAMTEPDVDFFRVARSGPGVLTVRLSAVPNLDLTLTVRDRGGHVLAAIDEDGARISVGGVALGALNVAVQRDAEERMHVLGVRTKRGAIAKDAGPKSSTPKVTAPNGTGLTALPRIELGAVAIDALRLTFVDESVTPRFELRDASARATLEPLVFGGAADGAPENVAKLRVEYREKSKRDILIGMILEDKILDLIESKSKITEGTLEEAQRAQAGKAGEAAEAKSEGEGDKPAKAKKKSKKGEEEG